MFAWFPNFLGTQKKKSWLPSNWQIIGLFQNLLYIYLKKNKNKAKHFLEGSILTDLTIKRTKEHNPFVIRMAGQASTWLWVVIIACNIWLQ